MITDNQVSVDDGMLISLTYDREQLLQAKNEYNKAALFTATLDEYKQVHDRILPEKPTKHLPEKAEIRGRA